MRLHGDSWTAIKYPRAIWDDQASCWVSDAEVAEVPYTAFTSKKKALQVTARLIVRRVRAKGKAEDAGQGGLFPAWRYHAIVEQVNPDLAGGPLAHLPSGRFNASAARQAFRIRRDAGPAHGPWESKEIAPGITNLPADLAGPRHIATCARRHWAVENEEHYVRDVTFREDAQKTRTGNQPNAHAGIRNLVTGAFRKKGHANIAAARRYYGRDDQRILALYGYA